MAGHNRISTQALTSVARAAAGEALGVPAHDVRADWSDDEGCSRSRWSCPSAVPNLTMVLRDPGRVAGFGGSIWDRAVAAKASDPAPRDRADRSAAEPRGHPHQRGHRARRRSGALSQDTQNAGLGSGPRDADAAPGSAPLGSGVAGMDRILKRETHSSRAVVSVIAAALVMAVCGYALLETAVRAIGQPPWLVDPQTAAERVVALPAESGRCYSSSSAP